MDKFEYEGEVYVRPIGRGITLLDVSNQDLADVLANVLSEVFGYRDGYGYLRIEFLPKTAEAVAAWNRRAADDGWIAVGERLPEEGQEFLAWDEVKKRPSVGRGYSPAFFTHWRPLPPPPGSEPAPGERRAVIGNILYDAKDALLALEAEYSEGESWGTRDALLASHLEAIIRNARILRGDEPAPDERAALGDAARRG